MSFCLCSIFNILPSLSLKIYVFLEQRHNDTFPIKNLPLHFVFCFVLFCFISCFFLYMDWMFLLFCLSYKEFITGSINFYRFRIECSTYLFPAYFYTERVLILLINKKRNLARIRVKGGGRAEGLSYSRHIQRWITQCIWSQEDHGHVSDCPGNWHNRIS